MPKGSGESLSKTQLDKLGDRLRLGTADDADRRALDRYRKSFSDTFDEVSDTIRTTLGLDPAIKYGGGPQHIRKGLLGLSSFLASVEPLEESLTETESRMLALESGAHHYAPTEPEFQLLAQEYRDKEAALRRLKQAFARILLEFRERLAR